SVAGIVANPIRSVAIIGGGAAGAALTIHLCRAGVQVVVFDRATRPPAVVGESLVPATIPFLRELGIEEEVAGYSTYKRGATFVLGPDDVLNFTFADVRGATTGYSYNVPREEFDASLSARAAECGAKVVRGTARVERVGDSDRVRLTPETLDLTEGFLREQPDLIVDASGRVRLLPNLLELPFTAGSRNDTALFAHCEGVAQVVEGDVHTDRLERGWSWRIPLPGKMSVGLVMDSDTLKKFGSTIDQQFDAYLKHDPLIALWGEHPRRLTPVLKYSNYQLVSRRGFGDGWVLAGDTFGFVDPVFSSGLLLAFDGAKQLSRAILAGGGERQMRRYEAHVARHIRAWQQTIDHFYSGRLFTLFRVGETMRESLLGRMLGPHFEKHLPRVFTGEASAKRYSVGLVDFMCKRALLDNDPRLLAIR
ncbi:MAG: tryptophan 7-halogenase, partial [Myxococcota bacterium]|nr:tryptophan 7-halogenase [Myxococcota bacterium]